MELLIKKSCAKCLLVIGAIFKTHNGKFKCFRLASFVTKVLGILFFTFGTLEAATVEVVDGRYKGDKFISINGLIEKGDSLKIEKAALRVIKNNNSRLYLLLNSDGGDLQEAMKIGRFSRKLLATTYVYGHNLYKPGTPTGARMVEIGTISQASAFSLYPVESDKLEKKDIVRCFSACVIIFYGGVSRYVSDNTDFRFGSKYKKNIPAIGIHRPYFDPKEYAKLSPQEAKEKYDQLEKSVRAYLSEMGAPTAIIDRMFRKSSNEIDLISGKDFEEFYHNKEPFLDEWIISRCGGFGPSSALTKSENEDYQLHRSSLKQAIDKGEINSTDEYHRFTLPGMTLSYIKKLESKINAHNSTVMACGDLEIYQYQSQWAEEF